MPLDICLTVQVRLLVVLANLLSSEDPCHWTTVTDYLNDAEPLPVVAILSHGFGYLMTAGHSERRYLMI